MKEIEKNAEITEKRTKKEGGEIRVVDLFLEERFYTVWGNPLKIISGPVYNSNSMILFLFYLVLVFWGWDELLS